MMSLNCLMTLIQCQIFKNISSTSQKNETLHTNPIHIHSNSVSSRLVFKTKDGYKLELQTFETMKLFGRTKQ